MIEPTRNAGTAPWPTDTDRIDHNFRNGRKLNAIRACYLTRDSHIKNHVIRHVPVWSVPNWLPRLTIINLRITWSRNKAKSRRYVRDSFRENPEKEKGRREIPIWCTIYPIHNLTTSKLQRQTSNCNRFCNALFYDSSWDSFHMPLFSERSKYSSVASSLHFLALRNCTTCPLWHVSFYGSQFIRQKTAWCFPDKILELSFALSCRW